jgi:hypothetical protein
MGREAHAGEHPGVTFAAADGDAGAENGADGEAGAAWRVATSAGPSCPH